MAPGKLALTPESTVELSPPTERLALPAVVATAAAAALVAVAVAPFEVAVVDAPPWDCPQHRVLFLCGLRKERWL